MCSACYRDKIMRVRVRKLDGISYEEIQYVVSKVMETVLT